MKLASLIAILFSIGCTSGNPVQADANLSDSSTVVHDSTFDDAVRRLYFNVGLANATSSVFDSFMTRESLKYNDTVLVQWDLNATIDAGNKNAEVASHRFIFKTSPLQGLKISTGEIVVRFLESPTTKKFYGLDWTVDFDNQQDGDEFFNKLKSIFQPLSTLQKVEEFSPCQFLAQYSTSKANETGIKGISIFFGKSPLSEKFQIRLLLSNEFNRGF